MYYALGDKEREYIEQIYTITHTYMQQQYKTKTLNKHKNIPLHSFNHISW